MKVSAREDALRGRRLAGPRLETVGFRASTPVPSRLQLGGTYFGGDGAMRMPAVQQARATPLERPAVPLVLAQGPGSLISPVPVPVPVVLPAPVVVAPASVELSGIAVVAAAIFLAGVASFAMKGK